VRLRPLLASLALLCLSLSAAAHEARPAYLQITEAPPGQYEVVWKRPQQGELTLALHVQLPERCRDVAPVARQVAPGALIERRLVACGEPGLSGGRIAIGGLSGTQTDALVRIQLRDGSVQTNLLKPASPSLTVEGRRSSGAVAGEYLALGVEHILLGVDHLLFVLGLVLIVRGGRRLVKTVTAFTAAHSITLAMATLGLVRVPQAPVEAVIALSILFLASELARQHRGEPGLTASRPWLVAFAFGLLHGFGFAGALAEVGLPQTDIPLALLMFNLGVEAGQLLFVAAVLSLWWLGRSAVASAPWWLRQVPAYAIGSLAAFWLIARVSAFG
jgi:hydrogenase/urease accessory protein HupE